jgi:thioredoxin 1
MAGQHVITFTDENFEKEVIKSDKPVLVDFWAEWCAPCRALAPTIDDLAAEYDGKVKVGKIDIEDNREVPSRFGIQAIPTLMIFKGGQLAKTLVGQKSKRELQAALNELA